MKRIILLTIAVALALPLAGCTIGELTPSPATTEPAPSLPGATAVPTATPSTLPVIASRKTTVAGVPVTIAINELSAASAVTTVVWTVTNAATDDDTRIQLRQDVFGDGQAATVPGTNDLVPGDAYALDGIYLLDGVNKLRYLPARDSHGVCVCSQGGGSIFIEAGTAMTFTAVFKAVAEGVESVDVYVPKAGTFSKVPVQR